jgi:hypothetical protein
MLVTLLASTPAQALLLDAWVSAVGSDSNPCSRTAPCATLSFALSQTLDGGIITVLDSGRDTDSGVNITKPITIIAGAEYRIEDVAVGIKVAAGVLDVVTLRGLHITFGAGSGILFTSGAALRVENCLIDGYGNGIDFEPTGASQLFVSDTIVKDNAAQGIRIRPTGAGTASVVLERVQVLDNDAGIVATAGGSSGAGTVVNIAVRDSVASSNVLAGILAKSQVGGPNVVMTLDRVAATSNGVGIEADGSDMGAGGIALSNTQVSGNGTGLMSVNGGVLASFGNNYVIGNGTDGAPTTTVAPK